MKKIGRRLLTEVLERHEGSIAIVGKGVAVCCRLMRKRLDQQEKQLVIKYVRKVIQ